MKQTSTFQPIQTIDERDLDLFSIVCPDECELLREQDAQIRKINKAEESYFNSNNIEEIIKFWEDLHSKGGLIFNSEKWYFRIVDLYIDHKDYKKAIVFLKIKDNS